MKSCLKNKNREKSGLWKHADESKIAEEKKNTIYMLPDESCVIRKKTSCISTKIPIEDVFDPKTNL